MKKIIHAVTGAFGYSGRHIATRLLSRGQQVITLTQSQPEPQVFEGRVAAHPLNFGDPEELVRSLENVAVLYNTYWVRFNHAGFSHEQAVKNSTVLFEAARRAGVQRIVHVSITNPDIHSSLEYFSGKARVESALQACGVSHSILRPAVLFGDGDILINNIAWALRRFPVFGVFGDGQYRLQPIHVENFADLAVREGEQAGNRLIQAIGPETFAYRDLVRGIGQAIGKPRPVIGVSPGIGYAFSLIIGACVKDVFVTREEIRGLMEDRLCVEAPPAGSTTLTGWLRANADTIGRRYASELARRRAICSA